MVCDTFKVCQQVVVNETEVESAVAVTQSLDMAKFDLVAKVIYDLFERLDFFAISMSLFVKASTVRTTILDSAELITPRSF